MGLGEDKALEMAAIGYLYIWTEAATEATPANSGGAKGKAEAPGCLRRQLTTPGLGKDGVPNLRPKADTLAFYLGTLRGCREKGNRAIFRKSTYHIAPFSCSPTEAGIKISY